MPLIFQKPVVVPPVIVQLRDGELVPIDYAAWLSVERGRVWITQAGDTRDHFLRTGQAMRLAAGCKALVGGEGAAQVSLMPAPTLLQGMRRQAAEWAHRFASAAAARRRRLARLALAGR